MQVIEDLDEHLLAVHGILMEDLPAERLQQFLEDPSIFDKDSETLEEIRKQLYGRGRMPILTAEAQAIGFACANPKLPKCFCRARFNRSSKTEPRLVLVQRDCT